MSRRSPAPVSRQIKLRKSASDRCEVRPLECVGDVFEQKWNRNPGLNHANFRDDGFGNRLGFRQRQQIREVTARNAGEREVLAERRRLEAIDDRRDLIQIGEIERRVCPDRQTNPVRRQRNHVDQIEDRGSQCPAAVKVVIDGYLKDIETIEIAARPLRDGRTKPDADGRLRAVTFALHTGGPVYLHPAGSGRAPNGSRSRTRSRPRLSSARGPSRRTAARRGRSLCRV